MTVLVTALHQLVLRRGLNHAKRARQSIKVHAGHSICLAGVLQAANLMSMDWLPQLLLKIPSEPHVPETS